MLSEKNVLMRLKHKISAATLSALVASLIVVNVIYGLVNSPHLKTEYFLSRRSDWCGLASTLVQA